MLLPCKNDIAILSTHLSLSLLTFSSFSKFDIVSDLHVVCNVWCYDNSVPLCCRSNGFQFTTKQNCVYNISMYKTVKNNNII